MSIGEPNHEVEMRSNMVAKYGQVWDTTELQQDYKVISFLAPAVFVERKSDGAKGTLYFTHSPRFYYSFQEDK